jgi:hypothetical protein
MGFKPTISVGELPHLTARKLNQLLDGRAIYEADNLMKKFMAIYGDRKCITVCRGIRHSGLSYLFKYCPHAYTGARGSAVG